MNVVHFVSSGERSKEWLHRLCIMFVAFATAACNYSGQTIAPLLYRRN